MTNFKSSRSTMIAKAFIAISALSVSNLTATAEIIESLSQCEASIAVKVVRCCDEVVKLNGKPMWMIDNHDTCKTSVVCFTGKKVSTCKIDVKFNPRDGSPNPPPPPPPPPPPSVVGKIG